MILLIHPPMSKPGEPPAGLACLAAALHHADVSCAVLDANLEGQLFLASQAGQGEELPAEAWTRRVLRYRHDIAASLRSPETYQQPPRYQRAVRDLNRLLQLAAAPYPGLDITLGNYREAGVNPLESRDLLRRAESYAEHIFFPYFSQRLPSLLEQNAIRFVGIALTFLSQALCAFALMGFLKKRWPEIQILLGGGLLSSWMSAPGWNNPFAGLVDHCIRGPGEEALLALFGRTAQTPYPPPDYKGLPQNYLSPTPVLPYAASRGCYWQGCAFCPEAAEKNAYQPVAPKTALAHLQLLSGDEPAGLIHLLDNAVSPALLAALAEGEGLGRPWYGFTRFHENLADEDFCRRLRASGCVLLKLGLESGSPEVLEAMGKGAGPELMSRVLHTLRRAGIPVYAYLLFGTPAESLAEARQTLAFTQAHQDCIAFLNLAVFSMPRYGEEASRFPEGRPFSGDLSLYQDFVHPSGWDRRSIRHFLDREFRRAPAVAAILRREPPFFTSNHAPFFGGVYPWFRLGKKAGPR